MTDDERAIHEQGYVDGQRRVWLGLLQEALRNLGIEDPEVSKARWASERVEAICRLRALCAECGDNDWPDDLHLADIIDKHLGDHLLK